MELYHKAARLLYITLVASGALVGGWLRAFCNYSRDARSGERLTWDVILSCVLEDGAMKWKEGVGWLEVIFIMFLEVVRNLFYRIRLQVCNVQVRSSAVALPCLLKKMPKSFRGCGKHPAGR